MQEIDGKIIYSEVNEIVESSHTALVVCDVQKMFIDFIFNKVEFMKNIKLLIESARRAKIPIFYTFAEMLPTKYESSARLYAYNKLFAKMQLRMPKKKEMSLAVDRKEGEGEM